MLAPAVTIVALLVLAPLVLVVRNSFATADEYGAVQGGFTWANYAALNDPAYFKVLGYSLEVAALNTLICITAGYVISIYVTSRPPTRQLLVLLLLVIPFWTDFLVRTFALINVLAPGGPLNTLTNAIGITHGPTSWVPSTGATFIGLVYAFLPTAVFPIYASLRGIDPNLSEAAADLGCGWWKTHFRVLIPMARQGILASILLVFIPTLGVYVIPVLLGGGKRQIVGNVIVTLYTEFRNAPLGAAASVVLLLLMMASVLVIGLLSRRLRRSL
nr:ABC transporter permease [Allobranchiibius huperziae]